MNDATNTQNSTQSSQASLVAATYTMRAIDVVDRMHARTATKLHEARNGMRTRLERALDRAEQLTTKLFEVARSSIQRADQLGADAVNRAQGVLNRGLDTAREVGAKRSQLPS